MVDLNVATVNEDVGAVRRTAGFLRRVKRGWNDENGGRCKDEGDASKDYYEL